MQFDLEAVREIMWQGMTEDKYRNAQEPIEDVSDEQGMTENEYRNAQEPIEGVFDEAGRSCVRLWAALASKFGKKKKGAGGEEGQLHGNVEYKLYRTRHQLFPIK